MRKAEEAKAEAERKKLLAERKELQRIEDFKNGFGRRICLDGRLNVYLAGLSQAGRPAQADGDGQAQAIIENVSVDSKNVQVRIVGWATDDRMFRYSSGFGFLSAPKMRGMELTPGRIYWNSIKGWYFCEET